MSHQRHWGCLTAMPRRMVQPVVIHVSCESDRQKREVKETAKERADKDIINILNCVIPSSLNYFICKHSLYIPRES